MSKSVVNKDEVVLTVLQSYVAKVLPHNLIDPKLQIEQRIQYLDGMLATISVGVLADKVENKNVAYTHMELPRWLKWLDRFIIKHERHLTLTAYQTYPQANIKIPKLNKMVINITKKDFEL